MSGTEGKDAEGQRVSKAGSKDCGQYWGDSVSRAGGKVCRQDCWRIDVVGIFHLFNLYFKEVECATFLCTQAGNC
jgi:hypothetical protein